MDTTTKDTTPVVAKKQETKSLSLPVVLLKQSDGKPSASFTMVFLAFNVCLLWLFLSIIEGVGPLKVRAFDAGQAMTFLTPLLGLYFSRRYTDKPKNSDPQIPKTEQSE